MAGPSTNPGVVRFGVYELDLRAGELRKSGLKIKLQDQPLQILAMLLERPGEIVTREELQKRLWPQDTFVDFDLSLNSAVKKLRQALGDDSENPRFVETLYRRGYRFIGSVNGGALTEEPAPFPEANVVHQPARTETRRSLRRLAWIIPSLLVLGLLALWLARPSLPPQVVGYTQITHDGLHKGGIVTDGGRLYFSELQEDHFVVAQVSVMGGETSVLPIPFDNAGLTDIADDGSTVLVGRFDDTDKLASLWAIPLPAGSPQRLYDSAGQSAAWSHDRSELVFARGADLYTAKGDGSQPRKLAAVGGRAFDLRFSPDGRKLRFVIGDPADGSSSIWEIRSDGSGLHPLLAGWNTTPHESGGNWTADGRFYLFDSFRDGKSSVWALPERTGWFGRPATPAQLTNGPLNFFGPVPARDGSKVFAIGALARSELVRYDARSGFTPYLNGISATDIDFSSDGQWIAYVSVPEQALWRSRADGSQRMQLTGPSMIAALPRWSPDGTQIVFMGRTPSTNWRAYLIPSGGGAARELLPGAELGFDPNWSPDGKSVVLTMHEGGTPGAPPSDLGIVMVDVESKKFSPLPGSAQLFSPRWSPDGKWIAAITDDSRKLVLFDRATEQWTELVNMPMGYPSWSHDSQYLYFDTTLTGEPAFFRIRVADHRLERLVSLSGLQRFWGVFGSWTGLARDDSLLLVRDTSSQEIYALDWKVP